MPNSLIFQGKPIDMAHILFKILPWCPGYLPVKRSHPWHIVFPTLAVDDCIGCFDGVEQHGCCGAGMVIKLDTNNLFICV